MRVVTIVSEIRVIGTLWMGGTAATNYRLTSFQLNEILGYCNDFYDKETNSAYNRAGVERWLMCHSGDFQNVIDFSITIGDNEFDSDWSNEESEYIYCDCMFPEHEHTSFFEEYELQNN